MSKKCFDDYTKATGQIVDDVKKELAQSEVDDRAQVSRQVVSAAVAAAVARSGGGSRPLRSSRWRRAVRRSLQAWRAWL